MIVCKFWKSCLLKERTDTVRDLLESSLWIDRLRGFWEVFFAIRLLRLQGQELVLKLDIFILTMTQPRRYALSVSPVCLGNPRGSVLFLWMCIKKTKHTVF